MVCRHHFCNYLCPCSQQLLLFECHSRQSNVVVFVHGLLMDSLPFLQLALLYMYMYYLYYMLGPHMLGTRNGCCELLSDICSSFGCVFLQYIGRGRSVGLDASSAIVSYRVAHYMGGLSSCLQRVYTCCRVSRHMLSCSLTTIPFHGRGTCVTWFDLCASTLSTSEVYSLMRLE